MNMDQNKSEKPKSAILFMVDPNSVSKEDAGKGYITEALLLFCLISGSILSFSSMFHLWTSWVWGTLIPLGISVLFTVIYHNQKLRKSILMVSVLVFFLLLVLMWNYFLWAIDSFF